MERPETRAVQIADGNVSNNFLTTFGRSSRGTPCTCEVKTQPTLAQALELVNGDTVSQAIERGGRMRDWLASEGSPQAAARRVYQTALSRDPSDTEKTFAGRCSIAPSSSSTTEAHHAYQTDLHRGHHRPRLCARSTGGGGPQLRRAHPANPAGELRPVPPLRQDERRPGCDKPFSPGEGGRLRTGRRGRRA